MRDKHSEDRPRAGERGARHQRSYGSKPSTGQQSASF